MPSDRRLHTKDELKQLFFNLKRKGITDEMITILVNVLWREKPSLRTSGFYWPGAPDLTMSWENSTRTLTLTPTVPDPAEEGAADYDPHFRFYSWAGQPVFNRIYEAEQIQIPDQEGLFFIYYDTNEETGLQELTYAKNPEWEDIAIIYLVKVLVTCIYWNADSNTVIYYGDELHGSEWTPSIHWWAHKAFNAIRDYGLRSTDIVIGDGSEDIHAQAGISEGAVWHEDLWYESDGIGSTVGLPILYRTVLGPRLTSNSGFPVTGAHMGRIYYNDGSLVEASEGRFVLCHLFWTNCFNNPLIAVMGQAQYDSAVEAIQGWQDELDGLDDWVPHQTRLLITTLIYETSSDFANSVQARIVGEMTPESIADIVSKENIPSLKTGWHPDILEHIGYSYSEASHSMILGLLGDNVTFYFVQGIKFKVENNLLFPSLPDVLGLTYVDGDGNSWTKSQTKWNEWETARVKAFAFYRNTRLSQTPYLGWRMHNWEMEGRTRGNIIQETGLEHLTGLVLSINETNDHQIDVTDGSLRLADIVAEIVHNSGNTFGQYLRSLRTRRHWLKTYIDETDPENPVITHEWEYQGSPAANVATLSAGNEVVVNVLIEGSWQLTETADGDYCAMWLIGTLDYAQPLKWITGNAYSSDLDEAKELNDPESLLSIIEGAQFITDHYEVIARVIVKNITDSPYYEIIEIDQYDDGEFDDLVTDLYVESAEYDSNSQTLTLHRTGDLPDIEIPMDLFSEMSIEGDGSPIYPFSLVNDQADPGQLYVYSTNSAGEKGWWPLYSSGDGSASGSAGSGGAGSSGSGSGTTPLIPGILEDRYVTAMIFNSETGKLTLQRSEGLADLEVTISGASEYENEDWTMTEARNIEAGTADTFVIVMKARAQFTIKSLVHEVDSGTLTGVSVKVDGVAVTGLSNLTVSTSETESTATSGNVVSAGQRVILEITTGYTGSPTKILYQLNLDR